MYEDSDAFLEPGIPDLVEMWKHQVALMTNEAEYLNQELVKARQNIAQLVAMNAALTDALRGALPAISPAQPT